MDSRSKLQEEIEPSKILTIEGKRIYTLAGRDVRKDDFCYPEDHYRTPGVLIEGLRSIPSEPFFAEFSPQEEFYRAPLPNREKYAQIFDHEAIASMTQALYIPVISDSLACVTCTLHLTGKNAVERLLKETGLGADNLRPLMKKSLEFTLTIL